MAESLFVTYDEKTFINRAQVEVMRRLPAAIYGYSLTSMGMTFMREDPPKVRIVPDEDQRRVLDNVNTFWAMAPKYAELGFPHRRGAMLYGPPGTGKTTTLRAMAKDTIDRLGIVLKLNDPNELRMAINAIRAAAPEQPIFVFLEDIDGWLREWNEEQLLDAMDGSFGADHLLWGATTNNIEKLSERLLRPSRFDTKLEIGLPTLAVRRNYIQGVLKKAPASLVEELAIATDGKSIAEVKEAILQRVVYTAPEAKVAKGAA